MRPYLALIQNDVRLAFRQRVVIFFNYLMPLVLFFVFAQSFHAAEGGQILRVVTMVSVIGILGNGLFGAGMRAVQDRETNVLRRYKVAPISPLPLLVSSTVTGLVVYLPFVAFIFFLAHSRYGMQLPAHATATALFITLGVLAFRAIGLILSSVVNTMAEAQILVQILYMAMLFLSGTTFPISFFPAWLAKVTQFIPSTYLVTGLQGIMLRNESLFDNWQASGALLLTVVIGMLLSVKLFRWEKNEKMRPAAKLWIVAVLLPFVVLGVWQSSAKDNVVKAKILDRDLSRSRTLLLRNARIFAGDGRVIENGGVLVKDGKIAAVYDGNVPDPKSVNAELVEAAGKTILPGLIDAQVYLGLRSGAPEGAAEQNQSPGDAGTADAGKVKEQALAAYLYSGVTAVRSVGAATDGMLAVREHINSGEKLGAEVFVVGLPRPAKSAADARQAVDDLKKAGVDGVEEVLDAGALGRGARRPDPKILDAIGEAAHADGLRLIAHTGDVGDLEDALHAGANSIEHGSAREKIPDAQFAAMAKAGAMYDPELSADEALRDFAAGKLDLLKRSLVQQVGPPELLDGIRRAIESPQWTAMRKTMGAAAGDAETARDNLKRAIGAGVTVVTGTGAGGPLVIHGPTVQHEVELWAGAGVPVEVALRAATLNGAKALGVESRTGSIEVGKEATMLVVEGNPLQDVKAIEAISFVIFKGERVDRGALLKGEKD